jgi:hypothetical protein
MDIFIFLSLIFLMFACVSFLVFFGFCGLRKYFRNKNKKERNKVLITKTVTKEKQVQQKSIIKSNAKSQSLQGGKEMEIAKTVAEIATPVVTSVASSIVSVFSSKSASKTAEEANERSKKNETRITKVETRVSNLESTVQDHEQMIKDNKQMIKELKENGQKLDKMLEGQEEKIEQLRKMNEGQEERLLESKKTTDLLAQLLLSMNGHTKKPFGVEQNDKSSAPTPVEKRVPAMEGVNNNRLSDYFNAEH